MKPQIRKKEESHLKNTILKLKKARKSATEKLDIISEENLERLKELRESGGSSYGYQTSDFDVLLEQLHQKNAALNLKGKYKSLEEIGFLLNEPYFSRIDLFDPLSRQTDKFYIGKFSYTEKKPVVTDWRSKVASVYYRYRYPQKGVFYDTPGGRQTRDLKIKRTFEIQDGKLVGYFDNDLQLDESSVIIEKIKTRSGGVLEDIVQTIQESQLDIIESDPRQICVVQGCVGSGKSTVAIHKLAHIFFNYPNLIHPERCLLVAKSQILAGYLSTLFPRLGIFDLTYKTVKDVAYNLMFQEGIKVNYDLSDIKNPFEFNPVKVRKLMKTVSMTQKDYERKINSIFKDPELGTFASFKYSFNQTPYENISDILEDVTEELNVQKEHIAKNPDSTQAWLYKENILALRKILRRSNEIRGEIKEKAVRRVSSKMDLNISRKLNYSEVLALLYIYSELVGITKFRKYEYCVVDEAQDFSSLEYLFLSKVVMRGRFALFGDLNQTLQENGIESWEIIPDVIKEARAAVKFELDKNYRSTKQIITFANKILKKYSTKYLPKSINRVGEEPLELLFQSLEEMYKKFEEEIRKDSKKIDKSIGIICFGGISEVEEILSKIRSLKDTVIKLEPNKKVTYVPRGVYLMSADDCKGLEFSKVYILELNLKKIKKLSEARKAFVSVTRAMNELFVFGVK
jgi:DNA helicase-2/ATP-dependent DNA helicase PcrA